MESQPTKPDPDSTGQTLSNERRASVRYLCNLETQCRPIAGTAANSWPACAVDVSTGGIALVLARRFERGAILSLRLENLNGEVARTLFLRVVHATMEEGGAWRLGCSFASELSEEELRPFQADRVRPSGPDFRAWVRFTCDVETSCQSVAPAQPGRWSARVLEVSPAGMSLLVPCQFERGTLLNVELPGTLGSIPRQVLVRVLGDRPLSSDQWILGCELADQLSDEDLQSFRVPPV
jgi:hypothetical protein